MVDKLKANKALQEDPTVEQRGLVVHEQRGLVVHQPSESESTGLLHDRPWYLSCKEDSRSSSEATHSHLKDGSGGVSFGSYCCLAWVVLGIVSALAASAWLHSSHGAALLQEARRRGVLGPPVQIVSAARVQKPAPLPAPRPALPPGRPDICSLSAPVPRPQPPPRWDTGPAWMRICEMKTRRAWEPKERNWCWVAVKNSCHSNLKMHLSWSTLRDIAASWGEAPPRSVEPFEPLKNGSLCDDPARGRSRKWTDEERSAARIWFRNHVAVYVLGLFSDTERWVMISKRLRDLRIWATHVPGVDMRAPRAIEVAKENGWVPKSFNFTHAQEMAYSSAQSMGSILGTLGCASAHFKAQTKVIADGLPLAVVFEDDSWPEEDFVERLWALVHEELPCDWEVTALYSRCPYGHCVSEHLSRVHPDGNEPDWLCRHGVNWGMQAVLYRTEVLPRVQKLWQSTVFNEERPHCMDVDVALASISDKVGFYAVPAAQDPGFLRETDHPSLRWNINVQGRKMHHPR